MDGTGRITQLLEAWGEGKEEAPDRLFPLVYDQLRRLASNNLNHERPDHTLETEALVHEAYLRLLDQKWIQWRSRAHFFSIVSIMMRRILASHARGRLSAKRGGRVMHLPLHETNGLFRELPAEHEIVDDALKRLAAVNPRQARVVELRYFGGMSNEEIAEVLGVSIPTVTRCWRVAKAWLYRHLDQHQEAYHA